MKKHFKWISLAICFALMLSAFAACAGAPMDYSGETLAAGEVGVEYYASVASAVADADGEAEITYALKSGSSLPSGLTLSPGGEITGIPSEKVSRKRFTVIAGAQNFVSAEADFRLTIAEGTLAFDAESLPRVAVNRPYGGALSVTGAGSEVTYSMIEGAMPTGLTFDNGSISGTPTVLGEEKTFKVTASAADSKSVTADFTLKIILPWLDYSSFELEKARQDVEYGETVATAAAPTTESTTITYALNGSLLPAGLSMNSEGYISGTPTQAGPAASFTVIASAAGFSSTEAVFSIVVRKPIVIEGEGTIIFNAVPLEPGYLNEAYHVATTDIRKGFASNGAAVTYSLKSGSSMPAGLVLQSGRIRPGTGANATLTAPGEHKFVIVASAEGCADVEAEFIFTVLPERLVYASEQINMATVGDAYTYSVATAKTRAGIATGISYALKGSMPAGLSLTNGQITGTPTKSAKEARITVIASADGYTSREAYFFIHIREAVIVVANGIFEAEYIDLTGMKGEGWSGSAYEEKIIQDTGSNASNGYFIGWTLYQNTYAFNFSSSQAVTGAGLKVRLATEFGNKTITPSHFEVRVNGESLPYGSFHLSGESGVMSDFEDYAVTVNGLNLKQGDNKIELVIKENNLLEGRVFGPAMDCVKIENFGSAVLTWRPCTYNVDWII